jgi:superfamily II RNA helicase
LEVPPEVQEWQERVAEIETELNAHPLRAFGNPGTLIKRSKRVARLQRQLEERKEAMRISLARHWEEFLDLIDILVSFDCLEESSMKPTRLGESIAAVRGDNELWLGLALASGELDSLAPDQFAAACAGLVMEVRADTWTTYDASPEVEEALGGLRGLRRQLFQAQRRYQVALPVWLERDALGLVEKWAQGEEWTELCGNTSLDEGDIVRILRRTLDFLSQIPHVPHLSGSLRLLARDASDCINRFPVKEDV